MKCPARASAGLRLSTIIMSGSVMHVLDLELTPKFLCSVDGGLYTGKNVYSIVSLAVHEMHKEQAFSMLWLRSGIKGHPSKYLKVPPENLAIGCLDAEWQVRATFYWYQQMKKDFPDSAMGGFTRLLHRYGPL